MCKTLGPAFILTLFLVPAGIRDHYGPERVEGMTCDSEVLGERGEVEDVLIGYFGPSDPCHARGGDMWRAACLAIEEANRAGGYKGVPFRLVAAWSENPWGSGVKKVVRLVYDDKVWAVVGGIDGPSTHLAEQVITKARLTLISPGSTDKTTNLINIPWMFSALPPDNLQTEVLAEAIKRRIAKGSFLMVSAVDHDSHLFVVELGKSLKKKRLAPAYHYQFKSGKRNIADLIDAVIKAEAEAVVISADCRQSAMLSVALREKGFEGLIFGGPRMGRRDFAPQAGDAAEGVIFPLLYVRGEQSRRLEEEFKKRFATRPDYLAVHTYDTVNLLIAAIRKGGLDRAAIRDAVQEISPWPGAAGPIRWDARGSNSRAVSLGTIRSGQTRVFTP